ncbi:hypothetical protein cand_002600 [Cryptosporidium andersoni]|uniref:Transmembrane protein n=1 Tax=Cryptosporidium andersoni TaxID=117008 RepID=A0A1J4MNW0_9CRYT|nr:hypothetical protein cand_002600 [Cryptosporidium andersoni]
MVAVINQSFVELLFLIVAFLGAISCLCRPDYNLPLFTFVWWSYFNLPEFRKNQHQRYIRRFILLSCIQDIIYIIYWTPLWFSFQWKTNEPSTFSCHILVTMSSIINVLLKVTILFILRGGSGSSIVTVTNTL